MNTEAFLQGYLHKEAGVGSLVKSVANKGGSVKNVLAKHVGEGSTYADFKRHISRQPKLEYGGAPLGSTKVKTTKQGELKSYKDPATGYTHTSTPPSMLQTIGKGVTTVPRLSGNASIDKAVTIPTLSLAAATGTEYVYNKNQDRIARDEDLTAKAAEARSAGNEIQARAYEKLRSPELIKSVVSGNVDLFPEDHPLAFINKGILPSVASYAMDTTSNTIANAKSNSRTYENLYKTPLAPVLSGLGKYFPKRSEAAILERAIMSGLTPEVRENMQKTPEGKLILSQVNAIEKATTPDQRAQAIQKLLEEHSKYKSALSSSKLP